MNERNSELERIQRGLLAEEDTVSLDDILADEELNALLEGKAEPAFEDPERINAPQGEMQYNNYANGYGEGAQPEEASDQKRDKVIIGLMITASALSLGIIGILVYWLQLL